ncbi:MAG: hypothetical protein ACPG5B_06845 [Chitinophagales bacterium]
MNKYKNLTLEDINANLVLDFLKDNNIKQKDLASQLGISEASLSTILRKAGINKKRQKALFFYFIQYHCLRKEKAGINAGDSIEVTEIVIDNKRYVIKTKLDKVKQKSYPINKALSKVSEQEHSKLSNKT